MVVAVVECALFVQPFRERFIVYKCTIRRSLSSSSVITFAFSKPPGKRKAKASEEGVDGMSKTYEIEEGEMHIS